MEIDYKKLRCSELYQKRIEKRASEQSKRTVLWDLFLGPSVIPRDMDIHLPIHDSPKSNFSHEGSLNADDDIQAGVFDPADWCLFSNSLLIPISGPGYTDVKPSDNDGLSYARRWEQPSKRPAIGYFWAFTLEYDPDTPTGFQKQLDWIWAKQDGNPSPLTQFDAFLRANYKDYRGYNITWTGNKSLHIHLIFNTTWLDRAALESWSNIRGDNPKHNLEKHYHGDINPDVIWEYYKSKWFDLAENFTSTTGIDVTFDSSLQTLEHKRRLPWGTRVEYKADNIHGFPVGTHIPQVVLEEKIFRTSPHGASGYFLSASEANSMPVPQSVAKTKPTIVDIPLGTDAELIDALTTYLKKEWGTEYPKPSHFNDEYGVYFFNHASDGNPSTYLGADFTHLVPRGKNAPSGDNIPHLPGYISLNDLLHNLLDFASDQDPEMITVDTSSDIRRSKTRAVKLPDQWFEFRARNAGRHSTRKIMNSVSYNSLRASAYVCITSVEGIGKSHHILATAIDYRMDDLTERYFAGHGLTKPISGFQVFACSSYAQAEEQFTSYMTDEHGNPRPDRHGVLLKSFSQWYREFFDDPKNAGRKDDRISYTDALVARFGSLLDAVYNRQPDVYHEITRRKNEAWQIPSPTSPYANRGVPQDSGFHQNFATILFTAHETAQNLHKPTKSQAWLHPDFDYETHAGDYDAYHPLALQFRVYRLIHDEVSLEDLLWVATPEEVTFAKTVKRSGSDSWSEMSMPDRYSAYSSLQDQAPVIDKTTMSFDRTLRVIQADFTKDDRIAVDFDALPYGTDNTEDGLYNGLTGTEYFLKEKSWWRSNRARVVFLTTERLPSKIIEGLRWEQKTDNSKEDSFAVRWWDRDHLFPVDRIPMELDTRANSSGVQELVDSVLGAEQRCTDVMITNIAKGNDVITHRSARGKNNLKDKNLASVLMYMGADQYGQLNVVSQRYGIEDAMELFYRDQFNQAVGRNRGFRRSAPPVEHRLVLSPKLYRELDGRDFFKIGRYQTYLVKV